MPTYAYKCSSCEEEQEHWLTMSQRTDTMPCACGGVANQVFNWGGETLVKGGERPFKLDPLCVPVGWEHGNTDCAKQEARYAQMIGEARKNARKNDKQAIKGGIRQIAKVPREIVRMRQNQYGKSYYDPSSQSAGELKAKLDADGLLHHKR